MSERRLARFLYTKWTTFNYESSITLSATLLYLQYKRPESQIPVGERAYRRLIPTPLHDLLLRVLFRAALQH